MYREVPSLQKPTANGNVLHARNRFYTLSNTKDKPISDITSNCFDGYHFKHLLCDTHKIHSTFYYTCSMFTEYKHQFETPYILN